MEGKREAARKGNPISTLCPTWLYWDAKEKQFKVKPEGRKALEYIFTQVAKGVGQKQITYHLNKHYKPLGRSKVWHCSFVGWVVRNRQVLGEYQPFTLADGKRIPDGPPIKNYYPAAVADDILSGQRDRRYPPKANRANLSIRQSFRRPGVSQRWLCVPHKIG